MNLLLLAASSLILNGEVNCLDHGDKNEHHIHNSFKVSSDPQYDGPITVHVVPHSHDDVGWRCTVDGYFDGSMRNI
jgi:hypothetical protein